MATWRHTLGLYPPWFVFERPHCKANTPYSFVLASACLQNPCGIRIVLRELARKYFTAVRLLVCSKTMKRCIKASLRARSLFLRRFRGSGIILYINPAPGAKRSRSVYTNISSQINPAPGAKRSRTVHTNIFRSKQPGSRSQKVPDRIRNSLLFPTRLRLSTQ